MDLEEAGEKWRAGDPTKALRFFVKAVNQYDAGLRIFPTSFDLAYNKARLQYEITQQPRLFRQLPDTLIDLLKAARESHIVAYQLNSSDADNMFNLGQVCTSLAEAMLDVRDLTEEHAKDASQLLQQALETLEACLRIQEKQIQEAEALSHTPASKDDGTSSIIDDTDPADAEVSEVWASVVEPLTTQDLFETCLARIEAVKGLCELQASSNVDAIGLIEATLSSDVRERLSQYGQHPDQVWRSTIAVAGVHSAYAEVRLQTTTADLNTFESDIQNSLGMLKSLPEAESREESLVALGETHLAYNSAIESFFARNETPKELIMSLNRRRWDHITAGLTSFTIASKLSPVTNLARIHVSRGDCELLRVRLGDQPCDYEFARKRHETLLKNAAVYYKAAKSVFSHQKSGTIDEVFELDLKLVITGILLGDSTVHLSDLTRGDDAKVSRQFADILAQGLLGAEMTSRVEQAFVTGR